MVVIVDYGGGGRGPSSPFNIFIQCIFIHFMFVTVIIIIIIIIYSNRNTYIFNPSNVKFLIKHFHNFY